MKKIFIVGNISLDLILGEIDEIPGWGIELLIPGYTMRPGGQASNTVFALGSMGAPVYVVGTIGKDHFGQDIRVAYEKWGVRTDYLFALSHVQTGLSVAITSQRTHERTFLTELGAQRELSVNHLKEVYSSISKGDFFLVCGYFLSNSIRNNELVSFLQKLKTEKPETVLCLDTGWPPEGWTNDIKNEILNILPYFDYFLPNEIEIDYLTDKNLASIFHNWSGTLIKKIGKEGSQVITFRDSVRIPTIPVEVKDTIGAGDYFNAGFIWGLWKGFRLMDAVKIGNIIASLNISIDAQRTKLARPEDVKKYIEDQNIF